MSVGELDGLLGDFARIFAKVPMGFCVFDTELRYRYLNAALADRNGHTVEAHLGRRISDIYPKLAKAVEPALREAMDSGAAVVTGAMTGLIPRPGGGVAYFRNTFSPILDSQGHVIGVSCLVADVTELTAAEGKLQAHLGNLESQAAERSRELETAKSELEEEVRDRRRAEEAERDSRQHFTDAIESMSQGFVIYDADDRIIVANRRIKELLPELAVVLIPGTHFSDLVSTAIAY